MVALKTPWPCHVFFSLLLLFCFLSSLYAEPNPLFGGHALRLQNDLGPTFQTSEIFHEKVIEARTIRKGDKLSFSYGLRSEDARPSTRVKFSISVSKKGGVPTPIFSETIQVSENYERRGWRNRELPLDVFAGQKLRFIFSSVVVQSDETLLQVDPPYAFWGGVRLGNFTRRKGEVNIILISLDTLRGDHLGIGGYWRDTSPNIDKLAQGGVYFKDAIATAPWTRPSHFSMMTGLFPTFQYDFLAAATRPLEQLAPEKRMLAEFLYLNGYVTQAFTAAGYVSAKYGFFRGFERYAERLADGDAHHVFSNTMDWLEDNQDKKFFLFVHTYEIHGPYRHKKYLKKEKDSSSIERTIAKYDSGIFYTDRYIGKLKEKLDGLNLSNDTLVILTSDHGEEFRERGNTGHGHTIYDELVHVPLLFYWPSKLKPRVVSDFQAQSPSLLPTILDFIGVPIPKTTQGKSLKSILRGGAVPSESIAFSQRNPNRRRAPEIKAVRYAGTKGKFKFILTPYYAYPDQDFALNRRSGKNEAAVTAKGKEYYDLAKDPDELNILKPEGDNAAVLGFLEKALVERYPTDYRRSTTLDRFDPNDTSEEQVDESLKEQLKALGY